MWEVMGVGGENEFKFYTLGSLAVKYYCEMENFEVGEWARVKVSEKA